MRGAVPAWLARLMLRSACSLTAAIASVLLPCTAAEIPIEPQPFTVTRTLTATVRPPDDAFPIRVDWKSGVTLSIDAIADHGSNVKKGGVLVRFDGRELEQKLAETTQAMSMADLAVAQAQEELAPLEETTRHKLEVSRRSAQVAKEDHAQFHAVQRKAREEQVAQQWERANQSLANQQEELRQLRKMYEADDLTEETEEIILSRQEYMVAAAQHELRMATLERDHTLATLLPREAAALAERERDTADALRAAESAMPLTLNKKRLELEGLRIQAAKAKQTLADLEHDHARLVVHAPADGILLHGAVEHGRWVPAAKPLTTRDPVTPHRAFATFVPSASPPVLAAALDEASARALSPDATGMAVFAGREDLDIRVKSGSPAATTLPDGTSLVTLAASWPQGWQPVIGSTAEVHLVVWHADDSLVVPTHALQPGPRGWSVEVKLADRGSARREVTRGRVSGSQTQILSGLEPGQVVIAPNPGG